MSFQDTSVFVVGGSDELTRALVDVSTQVAIVDSNIDTHHKYAKIIDKGLPSEEFFAKETNVSHLREVVD